MKPRYMSCATRPHEQNNTSLARLGLQVICRWRGDAMGLTLTVEVSPEGDCAVPLPRLGVRPGVPGRLHRAG